MALSRESANNGGAGASEPVRFPLGIVLDILFLGSTNIDAPFGMILGPHFNINVTG